MEIQLKNSKKYPFEINNTVYAKVHEETGINPFAGGDWSFNPTFLLSAAFHGINAGLKAENKELLSIDKYELGEQISDEQMMDIAVLFAQRQVKTAEYVIKKREKLETEKK